MRRASFFGIEFLSGVAVGAGLVAGGVGVMKLHAACKRETTTAPEIAEHTETAEHADHAAGDADESPHPEKKPRAPRRGKSAATARKSSEHEVHRAKSWKN